LYEDPAKSQFLKNHETDEHVVYIAV
jgi:hypothetical protein